MSRFQSARPLQFATRAALPALAFLWSGPARAYCQEVNASPPASYDPADAGCFGGQNGLPTLFWRNQCVGFSIQSRASRQASISETTLLATQAFAAWSNVKCPSGGTPSIFPSAFPPVDCNSVPSQAHNNAIIFRDDVWPYDDTSNTIGYTTLTVDLQSGEIYGADIEINSANFHIVTSGVAPANSYDLASILTHEAGHFLGLAHSADSTAVMYAHYKPGSAALTPDDVAGICAIYSPNGSRMTQAGPISATTCNSQPPNGFLTECGSIDSGFSVVASGPRAVATGGDGGAVSCATDSLSCAVGRGNARSGGAGVVACGLVALGALARRARRAPARKRGAAYGVWLSLATVGAMAAAGRNASASVSVTVLFGELVQRASAVAVVTPIEQSALWENGRIVTYTRARVDRLVTGKLPRDIWIRTLGGSVGKIAQLVEGEATFELGGRPSLVFLRAHVDPVTGAAAGTFGVVEGAQGEFPFAASEGQRSRLLVARDIGVLLPPHPREHVPLPGDARPAHDVLVDRPFEDAAREIAAVWALAHS